MATPQISKAKNSIGDNPKKLVENNSLVSIGQAAQILDVSIDTIRRWDKNGTIKSTRPDGKNRFFSVKDLETIKFAQPLTISEASEQLDISPSTLRRLEKKGLIGPKRNDAGERVYDRQALEGFLRSDYFLRQKEVEQEILKPLTQNGDDKKLESNGSTRHDPAVHALLGDHHEALASLKRFRKILLLSLAVTAGTFAVVIVVLTVLFLAFPESTAKTLGYERHDPSSRSFSFQANDSFLARQFKPFSQTALSIVEAVNPGLRNKIAPVGPIKDVNQIFAPDSQGNVKSLYTFTVPDTSYLHIPDTGLVVNLNSQFVQGKEPGTQAGNLAVLPLTTNLIKDGAITREKLAPGLLGSGGGGGGATYVTNNSATPQPAPASSTTTNSGVVTLQSAYDSSTSPELVLNSTNGGLTIRDASAPLGANLLEVQNNNGGTTYFGVTSSGTSLANGLTLTTGALNLTATSGALTLSGLAASSINTGTNALIITSSNFNASATGINSTAIGATTASTGAFSTLSSSSATGLTLGTSSSATGGIILKNATNANALTINSGVTSASYTLTMPTGQGGASTFLQNDGAGALSWATPAAGCSTCLFQVPTTTAQNTIAPTAASVVALTVKGTTGTAARIAEFYDSTATPTLQAYFDATGALTLSKALTAPTTTNTINGLIINSGAISGGTGITSSGSITFSGLSTAGVVHNSVAGLLSTSLVSLTADVSGILPLNNGGTNANLTASNGGIVYSNASALAILGGTATASQCLLSGSNSAPSWGSCSSGATTVKWSDLIDPTTGLTLNMGLNTTNLNYTTASGSPAFDPFTLAISNQGTSSGTQRGLVVRNSNFAGGGATNSLIQVDNADADSTVGVAIQVLNSGTTGFITTAVDASAIGIVNALSIGANRILGTTGTIQLDNFNVNSAGTVSIAAGQAYTGVNAITLSSGGGNTLTLKSALATGLTIDSSNTALQATGLNTINTSTSLSLNPNSGSSYTVDTTATTLGLFATPTTLNFAQGATTLNIATTGALTRAINIGTGTGVDTINIGTGGTGADLISIGSSANSWNITSGGLLTLGKGSTTTGQLSFASSTAAGTTTIQAGNQGASSFTWTLPTSQPAGTHFLANDGSGGLSWGLSATPINGIQDGGATNTLNAANFTQTWNWSTLTTQTGLVLGSANVGTGVQPGTANLTTGGLFAVGDANTNYIHTAAESANLAKLLFKDSSTNISGATTTNGLDIASTINTSGAGTKTVNPINVEAPTLSGCTSGACLWQGLSVTTQTNTNSLITQSGIHINTIGTSTAGTVNGLDIGAITSGAATENAIKIGTGWDTDIALASTDPTISIGDAGSTGLRITDGTNTLLTLKDQGTYGDLILSDKGSTGNPASCTAGEIYFNSVDKAFMGCTATNAWEQLDNAHGDATRTTTGDPLTVTTSDTLLSTVAITPTTTNNNVMINVSAKFVANGAPAPNSINLKVFRAATCTGTQIGGTITRVPPTTGETIPISLTFVDSGPTGGTSTSYAFCANMAGGISPTLTAAERVITVYEATTGAGADLAEIYYSHDGTIQPGEVVSLDNSLKAGVKRSTGAYDKSQLGVVSTKPGQLLSDSSNNSDVQVQVALAGRVPVKVSSENGPIHIGDRLTSSSTPGVAMKAIKAGPSIGVAMTEFSGQSEGSVIAFVNSAWYSGEISSLLPAGLEGDGSQKPVGYDDSSAILSKLATQVKQAQTAPAVNSSDVFADRIVAGLEIVAPKVTTNNLQVMNKDGLTAANIDKDGNANFSGALSAGSIGTSDVKASGGVSAASVETDQVVATEIGQRYYTNDGSIESGDVVSLDSTAAGKVKKADVPYAGDLIGVTTTAPGLLIDAKGSGSSVVVAAAGRVSVKVSTQNGAIKAGDALTASSTPGVAMKATKAGPIIGRAILGFDREGVSNIPVLVNNGVTPGDFGADINQLSGRLDSLEQKIQGTQTNQALPQTGIATKDGLPVTVDTLSTKHLTVDLDLMVNGALVVSGPAEFKGTALFDSLVTFNDNLLVKGDATFNGDVSFNNNSGGYGVIKPGQDKVAIVFGKPFKVPPVVTVSLSDGKFANYSYQNVTPTGFEIVLQQPATEELHFSWITLLVNAPNTYVSGSGPAQP